MGHSKPIEPIGQERNAQFRFEDFSPLSISASLESQPQAELHITLGESSRETKRRTG